jgi:hypothetical protein
MANFKRKRQQWKGVTDSGGYDGSYIPASFDSEKHMIRQQKRDKRKYEQQVRELEEPESED